MFWIAFFQVRRKRVFILLTRAGYTLPDIILDENCFSSLVENKRVLFALHCMQDHCMMHVPANAEWNPRSKVPLSQWLAVLKTLRIRPDWIVWETSWCPFRPPRP